MITNSNDKGQLNRYLYFINIMLSFSVSVDFSRKHRSITLLSYLFDIIKQTLDYKLNWRDEWPFNVNWLSILEMKNEGENVLIKWIWRHTFNVSSGNVWIEKMCMREFWTFICLGSLAESHKIFRQPHSLDNNHLAVLSFYETEFVTAWSKMQFFSFFPAILFLFSCILIPFEFEMKCYNLG